MFILFISFKLEKTTHPVPNTFTVYETNSIKTTQELVPLVEQPKTISIKHVAPRDLETLSDVDDAEIDQFFLSKEESAMKSIIWHNMHKNWVREQAEKKDLNVEKKNVKKKKKKEEESILFFFNFLYYFSYNHYNNLFYL